MKISDTYAQMPLTERTLLKWLRKNPNHFGVRIANDQGQPCDWYIYAETGKPCAVVIYRSGRKLACHGIATG